MSLLRQVCAAVLAAWVAAACASEPVDGYELQGVPARVEVLDAGFVRFENERMALEWFLLEMRRRARAVQWDAARMPLIEIHIAEGAKGVDGRWFSALRKELRKAGITSVALR